MKKDIRLTLSFDDVNTILTALANLPFKQVYEVIGKIHDQSNAQMQGVELEEDDEDDAN